MSGQTIRSDQDHITHPERHFGEIPAVPVQDGRGNKVVIGQQPQHLPQPKQIARKQASRRQPNQPGLADRLRYDRRTQTVVATGAAVLLAVGLLGSTLIPKDKEDGSSVRTTNEVATQSNNSSTNNSSTGSQQESQTPPQVRLEPATPDMGTQDALEAIFDTHALALNNGRRDLLDYVYAPGATDLRENAQERVDYYRDGFSGSASFDVEVLDEFTQADGTRVVTADITERIFQPDNDPSGDMASTRVTPIHADITLVPMEVAVPNEAGSEDLQTILVIRSMTGEQGPREIIPVS